MTDKDKKEAIKKKKTEGVKAFGTNATKTSGKDKGKKIDEAPTTKTKDN
jgi:hypothetical protein